MKVIVSSICLFILVFSVLPSCKTEKRTDIPNGITYDSISVAKVYHLDNDSTKPSCSLKINYIFPVKYTDEKVLANMQKELNFAMMEDEKYEVLKPVEAVSKYIEDYIENYKNDANEQFPDWQESHDTEDYFSYYKTLTTKVIFDMGGITSYRISSMDYKGGANSSTAYRNVVIDLKTGNMVSEQEIFLPEYRKLLNEILIRKIVTQNKVQKPDDLLEFGYWGIEDLTSNDNFSVDNTGLTYIFNPGEYSAPSLGEIRVLLPYNEIKDMLKDNSPISNFVGK
ncbi:DUF3298 domain-containing protein [Dysgonomonas sp. Marseille-P4677]|uniref:RsiV family protein n=1 Tax=Dysgonomonas sp. Marseille-P4677 TaxID=2364790 RepID=UPI00191242E6|nr:RsiV family protein [Dysgonomonas sp. Marseille-P4677]MBK5722073.1 DUF3298 domain-containing protein [Dysgonomonas sp. Marseille-P4677]